MVLREEMLVILIVICYLDGNSFFFFICISIEVVLYMLVLYGSIIEIDCYL